MHPPALSVVLATYNFGRFLPEALESVFAQTFRDFEIIVIDDGSTDGTAEIVRPYLDRITFISTPHQGVNAARNLGIERARGKYICFCDADDLYLPDKFEIQVGFLEAHPEIDFVFSDFSNFDDTGTLCESYLSKKRRFQRVPYRRDGVHRVFLESLFDAYLRERFILPGTMVVRSDYVREHGVYDDTVPAKVFYGGLIRSIDSAGVAYTDRVTVRRRWHESNLSRDTVAVHSGLVQTFGELLRRPSHQLTESQRRFAAWSASRSEFQLGLVAVGARDVERGRSHFHASLGVWPMQVRAYAMLAATFVPNATILIGRLESFYRRALSAWLLLMRGEPV